MEMKRKLAGFSACALVLSSLTVPVAHAASADFKDIDSHWAKGSIERWAGYDIVNGFGDNQFKPEDTMTRAQMAQILSKTLGLTATATTNPFTDVSDSDWFKDAILKCSAAGIMKGTSDTTANPNAEIFRQDAVTMMGRALGIEADGDTTTFNDNGNIGNWAIGFVNAMAKRGIVNGRSEGIFAPTDNIKRGEITTILDRAITTYVNTPNTEVTATGKGITLIAAPGVTVKGEAEDILIAPAATGTTKLDSVKVSGAVTMQAAEGTLVLGGKTTVAKLNVPMLATGAKITIEKDATVAAMTSEADNVAIDGTGKINNMTIASGKGVTIAGSVKVDKITNNSADPVKKGNTTVAANTTWNGTTTSGGGGGHRGGETDYSDLTVRFAADSAVKGYVTSVKPESGSAKDKGNSTYEVEQDTNVAIAVKFDETVDTATYTVGNDTTVNRIENVQEKDTGTLHIRANQVDRSAVDVTITATKPDAEPYTITIEQGENVETVTTTPANSAAEGAEITVNATFASGYELNTITVTDENGQTVTVTDGKFTMPAANVTVTVTAKPIVTDIALTIDFAEGENLVNGSVTSVTQGTQSITPTDGTYTYTVKSNDDVTVVVEFSAAAGNATCSIGTMTVADNKTTGTVIIHKDKLTGDAVTATITGYAVDHEKYSVEEGTHSEGVQSVTFAPAGDQGKDTEVTVTPTFADGYMLDKIEVKYTENNEDKTVTVTNGKFTMPAANVTVVVTAKKKDLQIVPLGGTSGETPYMNLSVLKNDALVSVENPAQVGDTITLVALEPAGYQIKGTSTPDDTTDDAKPVVVITGVTGDEATPIAVKEVAVPSSVTGGIKAWTFTMPAKGVTASLEAEPQTFTVTFEVGDEAEAASVTVPAPVLMKKGEKFITTGDNKNQPDDPTWEGHKFLGWFIKNEDGTSTQEFNFEQNPVQQAMTLVAHWESNVVLTDSTADVDTSHVTLSFRDDPTGAYVEAQGSPKTITFGANKTIYVKAVVTQGYEIKAANFTGVTVTDDTGDTTALNTYYFKFTMPDTAATITATTTEQISTLTLQRVDQITAVKVTVTSSNETGSPVTLIYDAGNENSNGGKIEGLKKTNEVTVTMAAADGTSTDLSSYALVLKEVDESGGKNLTIGAVSNNTATVTMKGGDAKLVVTVNTSGSVANAEAAINEMVGITGSNTTASKTVDTTWTKLITAIHHYEMATAYKDSLPEDTTGTTTKADIATKLTTLKGYLNAVESLTVTDADICSFDISLAPIGKYFTAVKTLKVGSSVEADKANLANIKDLGGIANLTTLVNVDLSNTGITSIGEGLKKSASSLKTLNLSNTSVTASGLGGLVITDNVAWRN